jgi:hypothetical protein
LTKQEQKNKSNAKDKLSDTLPLLLVHVTMILKYGIGNQIYLLGNINHQNSDNQSTSSPLSALQFHSYPWYHLPCFPTETRYWRMCERLTLIWLGGYQWVKYRLLSVENNIFANLLNKKYLLTPWKNNIKIVLFPNLAMENNFLLLGYKRGKEIERRNWKNQPRGFLLSKAALSCWDNDMSS